VTALAFADPVTGASPGFQTRAFEAPAPALLSPPQPVRSPSLYTIKLRQKNRDRLRLFPAARMLGRVGRSYFEAEIRNQLPQQVGEIPKNLYSEGVRPDLEKHYGENRISERARPVNILSRSANSIMFTGKVQLDQCLSGVAYADPVRRAECARKACKRYCRRYHDKELARARDYPTAMANPQKATAIRTPPKPKNLSMVMASRVSSVPRPSTAPRRRAGFSESPPSRAPARRLAVCVSRTSWLQLGELFKFCVLAVA
jgi:hypothetical protein